MNLTQNTKTYKVKRPDGQIWDIPEENLDKAISLGGEVIENYNSSSIQNNSGKLIKVKRPDGQIWEIPEGNLDKAKQLGGIVIDEEDNHNLLESKSKESVPSIRQQVEEFNKRENKKEIKPREVARSARDFATGIADTMDFLATPAREAINLGAKVIGSDLRAHPLAEGVEKGIDSITGRYTQDVSDQDRINSAIRRGLSGFAFGAPLGTALQAYKFSPNISAISNYLKQSYSPTATNLASSAATSGAMQSSLNEQPDNPLGAVGKGFIAGIGTPLAIGALNLMSPEGRANFAKNIPNWFGNKFSINPSKSVSFRESGISPTLGDVSDSNVIKMIQNKLEKLPTGEPIKRLRDIQRQQIESALGQGPQGEDLGRIAASKLTMKGAKQYQSSKEEIHAPMFQKIESDIEILPDDMISIDPINKFLKPVFDKFKKPSQQNRFNKSSVGKIYTELFNEAVDENGKLPYSVLKGYLDDANDIITGRELIGKHSKKQLQAFAGSIAKAIDDGLTPKFQELGGEAYDNWKNARRLYHEYAEGSIPKLNELYKKDKKEAVKAFKDLIENQKESGIKTKLAMEGLQPKERIDLLNNINKELGRMPDGSFSATKWATAFNGLESEAKNSLLSPLNESNRKKVYAIAKSIDDMKSTLNQANTSATSYYAALGALGTAGYQSVLSLFGGNPLPIASLGAGLITTHIASDKLMANPKFINWMYKAMRAKNIKQFGKIIDHPPKISEFTKTSLRELHNFQSVLKNPKNIPQEEKKE